MKRAVLAFLLLAVSCTLGDDQMANDAAIGKAETLEISRISETQYIFSYVTVDDGTDTGKAAGVGVRFHHGDENRWWLMHDMVHWDNEGYEPGIRVERTLDLQALFIDPDANTLLPLPEGGETTRFKVITYRREADGSRTWGHKYPGDNDGTGEAFIHTWETWPLPDPEPEPEPTVQQAFSTIAPRAGDTGFHVSLTWEDPIDIVTFRIDSKFLYEIPAGTPGEEEVKFIELDRTLVEGEVVTVDSIATFEGRDSEPYPDQPFEVITLAASEPTPEPEPEPELEPEPEPANNPIVSIEIIEEEVDSLIVTWEDGSRAEVRRFSPWRGVFDWLMGSIWLSKKLPPEDIA